MKSSLSQNVTDDTNSLRIIRHIYQSRRVWNFWSDGGRDGGTAHSERRRASTYDRCRAALARSLASHAGLEASSGSQPISQAYLDSGNFYGNGLGLEILAIQNCSCGLYNFEISCLAASPDLEC